MKYPPFTTLIDCPRSPTSLRATLTSTMALPHCHWLLGQSREVEREIDDAEVE